MKFNAKIRTIGQGQEILQDLQRPQELLFQTYLRQGDDYQRGIHFLNLVRKNLSLKLLYSQSYHQGFDLKREGIHPKTNLPIETFETTQLFLKFRKIRLSGNLLLQ